MLTTFPSGDGDPGADAITRNPHDHGRAHPDAFDTVSNDLRVRDTVRDTDPRGTAELSHAGELPMRDQGALQLLVQLRLLTYAQLRASCYLNAHASVTRRRIAQLVRRGAVTTWEVPARTGGHTRFAIPTLGTLQTCLALLEAEASTQPFAPLVRLMLPGSLKRPLHVKGDVAPNWLAHQVEVNALVLRTREATPLRWATTWDCPFPRRVASFDLPQPDYVLVEEAEDGPRLVFGEHDRGSEPVDRFIARKVLLYAALASFPDACLQHFGLPTFSVRVSVTDPVRRAPLRRLSELVNATYRAGGPDAARYFRFTLAGWLHAAPAEAVWFAPGDVLAHDALRWASHQTRTRHTA